jgi:hypothetical protein
MELKARSLNESDWETMSSWWKWWRWPEVSKEVLPLNGLGGIMICKGEEPVAAGFLYLSNSKVAWLDWIISSPTYKESDRKDALEMLINTLEDVAKQQGYTIIISITRSNSLIETHKKLGYTVDETPSYEISKKIT